VGRCARLPVFALARSSVWSQAAKYASTLLLRVFLVGSIVRAPFVFATRRAFVSLSRRHKYGIAKNAVFALIMLFLIIPERAFRPFSARLCAKLFLF
jgi:hypothetical protein